MDLSIIMKYSKRFKDRYMVKMFEHDWHALKKVSGYSATLTVEYKLWKVV